MRTLLILFAVLVLWTAPGFGWDNPNRAAAPPVRITAENSTDIMLENRRVHSIQGDTFTYDTGAGMITVQADSTAARRFVRDVQAGRKSARVGVILFPDRESPFNTKFKAR